MPARIRPTLVAVAASLALLAAACGEKEPTPASSASAAPGSDAATAAVTDEDYPAATFSDPTTIDNPWAPLVPGTRFTYTGTVLEEGKPVEHTVVFTVTDLTKVIDGVPTVVIDDRDFVEGELAEGELAFFAQDDAGNVWLMGEYPEEWDAGSFEGAPDTWIAGVQGARPGVHMLADPQVGTDPYLQGWAPKIEFNDTAKVDRTGLQQVCVPLACYDDVLLMREWNPTEPLSFQMKYYAPGVGNVKVGFDGAKEKDHERLGLAGLTQLDGDAMVRERAHALELEARAYEASKAVYGTTPPSEPA